MNHDLPSDTKLMQTSKRNGYQDPLTASSSVGRMELFGRCSRVLIVWNRQLISSTQNNSHNGNDIWTPWKTNGSMEARKKCRPHDCCVWACQWLLLCAVTVHFLWEELQWVSPRFLGGASHSWSFVDREVGRFLRVGSSCPVED